MYDSLRFKYLETLDLDLIGKNTASEPDMVSRGQLDEPPQQNRYPIDFRPVRTAKVFEGMGAPLT
jgi:hypothetical protein